jgi:ribonuclease P protein component
MLPKKNRFKTSTFPRGRAIRRSFVWGSVSLTTAADFKAAVVVSKKIVKSAVDRNRVRRRVYAALAQAKPASGSFVVYPRAGALTVSPTLLVADIRSVR